MPRRRPAIDVALALTALLALTAASGAAQAPASPPLIVFGDADFPPYESLNDRGQPVGANIDLWRAIGRQLHRDIDIRLGPWAESQEKVLRGEGDALTFLNITDERQKLYDFTQPTFTFRFPVFVRADEAARFNTRDLTGKQIAVKRGGFPVAVLAERHPEATVVPVDNVVDGFRMLLRGEVDGVIESEWVGNELIRTNGFAGIRATSATLAVRTAHVAIPKGHPELLALLSGAIKAVADSGELDRIADKWAGRNFIFWDREMFREVAIEGGVGLAVLLGAFGFLYALRVRRSNRLLQGEIAARRATEAELTTTQGALSAIMDHAVDGLITLDERGTILSFSKPAERIFRRAADEVIGQNIALILFDPSRADQAGDASYDIAALADPAEASGAGREMEGRRKDGAVFPVDVAISVLPSSGTRRFVATVRDMTERKLTQARLDHAQKTEAIGQLAAGIAHDFNNILGAVGGFAEFLVQDLPKDTPQHGYAQRIVRASSRAKDLVHQILAFSQQSAAERKPTDLAPITLETCDLLRASLPSTTRLDVAVAKEELVADVSPIQFNQILLNLCVNASDALAGQPGRVAVELSRVRPGDPDYAAFRNGGLPREASAFPVEGRAFAGALAPPLSYARIIIADSGMGMSPEVLKRVFDPFFTTKERGRGTGLGLSVVHGIVMSYDGACVIASRPGGGTMVVIYLPLTERVAATAPRPAQAMRAAARGHERIMIIDDELDITDSLTIGLKRFGYDAVAMNEPKKALAAFAAAPDAWDMVVGDQSMPSMTGRALFAQLKKLRPTLRFILCSGFGDGTSEKTALADGIDAFLLKPVSAEQLSLVIRQILDHTPATSPAKVAS